jgi:hypothetical protein
VSGKARGRCVHHMDPYRLGNAGVCVCEWGWLGFRGQQARERAEHCLACGLASQLPQPLPHVLAHSNTVLEPFSCRLCLRPLMTLPWFCVVLCLQL